MSRSVNLGFKYVRRAPYQAIAVVLVMAITFFVFTITSLVVFGSERLLRYVETRPQIIAFLKTETTSDAQNTLTEKLSKDSRIKDVKVVTKDEAFDIYKTATSDNPLLGQLVSPSIFPASIEFSLTDLSHAQAVISEVKENPAVDTVGFTANLGGESQLGATIDHLRNIAKSIRIAGVASVSVLVGTSFFVLLVVMSMRVSMRKNEIESMSLLGASGSFIRAPIVVEAIVYALLGAFIGWATSLLLVLYSSPALLKYFGQIEILPRPLPELMTLLGLIFGIEVLVALLISSIGAIIAVARSLRMIK